MPRYKGLSPKQEAFVQAYLRTGNQRTAYKEAYNTENTKDNVVDVKACELLKNGKVAVRVAELQERMAKKTERTVASIDKMLQAVYDRAMIQGDENLAAANGAAMGIAKLNGLIIEKRDVKSDNKHTFEPEPLSETARFIETVAGTETERDGKKPLLN